MARNRKSYGHFKARRKLPLKIAPSEEDASYNTNLKNSTKAFMCLVIVVMATVNTMTVPVPPKFRNPWILRLSLGVFKIYTYLHDVVEYIWDVNVRFLCFKSTFKPPPSPPDVWGMDVQTVDTLFGGVPVRIYEPPRSDSETSQRSSGSSLKAGIIFFHGGGWFIGSIRMYDAFCRALADATGAVVVSVEYRLAPEYYYPTPVNDCESATKHFLTHAHLYGVDANRIAIVGDSAGGNLAASVNLKLRDAHFRPKPHLQVLVYPALQALDLRTPSYQQNAYDPILSQRFMAGFWLLYAQGTVKNIEAMVSNNHTTPDVKRALYTSVLSHERLPRKYVSDDYRPNALSHGDEAMWTSLRDKLTDPYFSPLLAANLSALPRTFIMTMEHDVLRDEGFLYADRLREAGVNTTYVHYESGFHGLISYPIPLVEDCKIATRKVYDFLRQHL